MSNLFNRLAFPTLLLAAALGSGCADQDLDLDDPPHGLDPLLHIGPELFAVHSGATFTLKAQGPAAVRKRLVWSLQDSAGQGHVCAGSVSDQGVVTAGSALGRFYFVQAVDPDNPAVAARARGEIVANPDPDLSRGLPPGWRSDDGALFRLRYPDGLGDDARRVGEAVTEAITALDRWFAGRSRPLAERRYRLTVSIYPHATDKASSVRATIVTRRGGGQASAELHLLAPSRYCRGLAGEAGGMADAALRSLVTHEVATLYLDDLTQAKAQGWRFFEAPDWFIQGAEEYLADTLTSAAGADATAWLGRAERARIGILVQDVYGDGALIVRYLRDRFGAQVLEKLLRSPAPSFWRAMADETGLDPQALLDDYHAWLAQDHKAR